ncbi:PLP-dependent transferase [Candidatus Haliotispira prima]|uniref:PLP-dependent transferase n=1 Tax=Candidatus Haliotispira prima TaxID=3034016 RepID=A0ABY8MF93_9SPIO|nr:PLP-dependent transferase [Candidatus Haliotispira prima]
METKKISHDSICALAGVDRESQHKAVVAPIYTSSIYRMADFGVEGEHEYARVSHPNRSHLAEALSEMEGGCGKGIITASGMAALNLILQLVQPGDWVVSGHDAYGGTQRFLDALAPRGLFRLHCCDINSPDPAVAERAMALQPRLVLLETPSNPLLGVCDVRAWIEAVAKTRDAQGRRPVVAVDNTMLSPVNFRPLSLGVDLVWHSTTKYINGHTDLIGGAIICREPDLHDELDWWVKTMGLGAAAFDAWLTTRGLHTLPLRIRREQESAGQVAEFLAGHPKVDQVFYPGLESHVGHELAVRQFAGFGGMLSFELRGRGGQKTGADTTAEELKTFIYAQKAASFAVSLGGVSSLISHPSTMTHIDMSEEARAAAGIRYGLLRFSVGLEEPERLICGLEQGFAAL